MYISFVQFKFQIRNFFYTLQFVFKIQIRNFIYTLQFVLRGPIEKNRISHCYDTI